MSLKLLPKEALLQTSSIDHPDWNYRPFLSVVQRMRFGMVLRLLGGEHFTRLLDVGYGSGVFMPALAERCDELHGIDPHGLSAQVGANLTRHGVRASLTQGSAEALPYPDGFFHCAVSVSAMEFVPDIDVAAAEIRRVLRPGGTLVVVTPGDSRLWDLALRVSTRETPAIYGDRRRKVQPSLRRQFRVVREARVPNLGGAAIRLYTGLRLQAD